MPVLVGLAPLAPPPVTPGTVELPTRALLGDSGIVLGDVDAYGCTWNWSPSNAWGPKPAPREQTGDRSYDHGQWDFSRYYGPRMIPIPGHVRAPDHTTLHAAEQRLRDAVGVNQFTFRVMEPGFDGYAMVRQQGELLWSEVNRNTATFSIGLYAPDPLIYSMNPETFELAFPTSTGGRQWPTSWPGSWDAVTVSGSAVLANEGAFSIGLDLRVDGPASTVTIAFPDTGEALNLDNPDGPLLLGEGEWLNVNTTTTEVVLNGDAHRRSWAYGEWLTLPTGLTKIAIAGTGVTTDSRVRGITRPVRL